MDDVLDKHSRCEIRMHSKSIGKLLKPKKIDQDKFRISREAWGINGVVLGLHGNTYAYMN